MSDETTTVTQLRRLVAGFVAEREWQRYHDPKNLSMAIAIETAELMEHFQWVRSDELPELLRDQRHKAKIGEEIADIMCFLLALANTLELDLSSAVARKIEKNAAKYPVQTFRGRYFKPGGKPAGQA
ncbi:MAG: nucleotide pyrophosphohydrolase [Phycisphaerae bacterium]